jgi:glycosyltransferase involved in cell wall biosynthesis
MNKKKVVVFGPGPMFKGGMANYTSSLAKAFDRFTEAETHIVSWTQQYPAIIPRDFIDRASKTDVLAGTNIKVHYLTNYNNPLSWRETVDAIKEINPDLVVFQWSVAVQGLPLGYIARKIKAETNIEVVFDLHFVIQKEQSSLDKMLSKYGLAVADTYIVHAYKTAEELETLYPKKQFLINETGARAPKGTATVIKLYHPVYDMFKIDPNFDVEAQKKALGLKKHVFLFFGFIRKYKGLHHCLEAFAEVARQRDDVSLLIVGESFWQTLDTSKFSTKVKTALFGMAKSMFLKNTDNEQDYNPLGTIEKLGIKDCTTVINDFVPNEDVHKYFQVSDSILLFYEYATPSGVESMAYNFKIPVLATKVGHFPETIKHGFNGYLAEAENTQDMAKQMLASIEKPIDRENVDAMAKKFSWDNYAATLLQNKKSAAHIAV